MYRCIDDIGVCVLVMILFPSSFAARPQVLEMLRRRGASSEENIDAMGLLQTLCLVKMDTVDGRKAFSTAGKQPVKAGAAADCHAGAASNDCRSLERPVGNDHRLETEMKGELLKETQLHRVSVHLHKVIIMMFTAGTQHGKGCGYL